FRYFFFPFHSTSPTLLYSLSLHDALPIFAEVLSLRHSAPDRGIQTIPDIGLRNYLRYQIPSCAARLPQGYAGKRPRERRRSSPRSEEHTSELQSRFDLVCRLLLEKKNNNL